MLFDSNVNIRKYIFSNEGLLYILIAFVWANPIVKIFNAVFLRIPILSEYGPYADIIVTTAIALLSFSAIIKHLRLQDLLIWLLLIFVYLLQFIRPGLSDIVNEQLTENAYLVLFWTIPMYFVGCILDINKVHKLLFWASVICICYFLYHNLFYERALDGSLEGYKQHTSYDLLPHTVYCIYYCFTHRSKIGVLCALLALFLHISLGARGPLVCIFSFFAIYVAFFLKMIHKKLVIAIIAVCAILIVSNIELIALALSHIISDLGMSTRVIDKILFEEFADHDSRNDIINVLMDKMQTAGLFGYGLFGSWQYVGIYAHRIYVDFWFSFGYVLGTLIMIVLCYYYYKGLRCCQTLDETSFWLVLAIISILHLMFSQFFLTNVHFWMFLGYCVGRIRRTELNSIT